MHSANAGNGLHRDDGFWNHRHVESYSVTGLNTELVKDVGSFLDLDKKIKVGVNLGVASFAFKEQCHSLAPAGFNVTI